MESLAEIKSEVDRRAALIGATGHHSLPTYGHTEDGARPHIEVDSRGYHFVLSKSSECTKSHALPRMTSTSLFYRICQSVTSDLAFAYEVAHRVETQDCRR